MCGYAGIYEFASGSEVDPVVLRSMTDTLAHRGPDGEGFWTSPDRAVGFGHRRLAIVDVQGGQQPMSGAHGEVLSFNGEIYNYPALRRRLEAEGTVFTTNCDTEVILHLYARHGEGCVEHLNGMFSFALWDPHRERLLLARDRVGEKPLYWHQSGGRLVFGSEIKALLEHPAVPREVDTDALEGYLANLVTSAPSTLYRGIGKLPPGTIGLCDRDGLRVRRYWDVSAPREWGEAGDDPAATVREMLERSVDERLMSDVPLGVLLSGGLDSTTLVALLRERARGLATFCVGFRDNPALDERDEARRAARHYGTDHHEIEIDESDAIDFLGGMVHHQDEPLADPVCLPLHFVCGLARDQGVKVVLAGEGSDELFWGYPHYVQALARWPWTRRALRLPSPVRRALPHLVRPGSHPYLRERLDALATGRAGPAHFPPGLGFYDRRALLAGDGELIPDWTPSDGGRDRGADLRTLAFDTQEYEFGLRLPELLLMRIDRFSMANSVEARVPFLDPDLVSYLYRLPLEHKLDGQTTKVLLRRAVADVVPDWVLNRRKQGFGAPVNRWFDTRLGSALRRLMREDSIRAYFDTEALETALAARARGESAMPLWPVFNFALWHRQWIEQESLDPILAPLGWSREAARAAA